MIFSVISFNLRASACICGSLSRFLPLRDSPRRPPSAVNLPLWVANRYSVVKEPALPARWVIHDSRRWFTKFPQAIKHVLSPASQCEVFSVQFSACSKFPKFVPSHYCHLLPDLLSCASAACGSGAILVPF
jgi:hypothetical protein